MNAIILEKILDLSNNDNMLGGEILRNIMDQFNNIEYQIDPLNKEAEVFYNNDYICTILKDGGVIVY